MENLELSIYNRSQLLLGDEVMTAMARTRVLVVGIGGVGSWCAEGLLRSGVTDITIVDSDKVCVTNVNRQVMATAATVGQVKVEALKSHLLEINPHGRITAIEKAYCAETAAEFDLDSYDYVVDAIDSLKDKYRLILDASANRAKLFCSMGAALKLDPTKVRVAEFWSVRGCPLGAALRKKMKKNKTLPAKKVLCVYDEEVLPNRGENRDVETAPSSFKKARTNGSLVHITAIFGMTISGLIIKDIYDSCYEKKH
ncbi:MAG: ThiF family adenylyltransferase [Candidatus Cryptobacteroides sp.]